MASEALKLDWSTQDPLLLGPYRGPQGAKAKAFLVSGEKAGWRIARIRSGPGWPGSLARLDRLAAIPHSKHDVSAMSDGYGVIVSYESESGEAIPLCVRDPAGRTHWSFDPRHWIEGLLSEQYVEAWNRPLPSRVPLVNYNRVPNFIKGALQPTSRLDAARSNAVAFPQVPLDDLVDEIRRLCMTLAFDSPPQASALWPDGHSAAVTVCHDVDTAWILEPAQAKLLREILAAETDLGHRGAWYVTGQQLNRRRHAAAIEAIQDAGHELAAHGWKHDAKLDYLSQSQQERRMLLAKQRFEGLGGRGIRTPWYGRSPQLMQVLDRHFEYSSSVPNASAFFSSGSNSGCCTFFPFRLEGAPIELPLTLPPDTAGEREAVYPLLLRCAHQIAAQGGVIVVTLHPQPHQSGSRDGIAAHARFLEDLEQSLGATLWKATPLEIVSRYQDALRA